MSIQKNISDKKDAFSRLADDYLVKPFQFEELLMRMEALKRRKSLTEVPSEIITIEDLIIDDPEVCKINIKEKLPKIEINLVYVKKYLTIVPTKFIKKFIDDKFDN